MTNLTLELLHHADNSLTYQPSHWQPDSAAWEQLAAVYAADAGLTSYTADVLASHWHEQKASLIVHKGMIISYVAVKVGYDGAIRAQLASQLGISPHQLPDGIVYRGTSGWTHEQWRKRGLGLAVRRPLYERILHGRALYVGTTSFVGVTPIWARLGWRIVSWVEYRFLSSLDGWYDRTPNTDGLVYRYYTVGHGWGEYDPQLPWDGGHVSPFENSEHDWYKYGHLGVSNEALAHEFNVAIAHAVGDDVERWRAVIAAVLG